MRLPIYAWKETLTRLGRRAVVRTRKREIHRAHLEQLEPRTLRTVTPGFTADTSMTTLVMPLLDTSADATLGDGAPSHPARNDLWQEYLQSHSDIHSGKEIRDSAAPPTQDELLAIDPPVSEIGEQPIGSGVPQIPEDSQTTAAPVTTLQGIKSHVRQEFKQWRASIGVAVQPDDELTSELPAPSDAVSADPAEIALSQTDPSFNLQLAESSSQSLYQTALDTANSAYDLSVALATLNRRIAQEQADDAYTAALQSADDAYWDDLHTADQNYKSDVQSVWQQYQDDVQTARAAYDAALKNNPQINRTQYNRFIDQINQAWDDYNQAVQQNYDDTDGIDADAAELAERAREDAQAFHDAIVVVYQAERDLAKLVRQFQHSVLEDRVSDGEVFAEALATARMDFQQALADKAFLRDHPHPGPLPRGEGVWRAALGSRPTYCLLRVSASRR